MIMDCSEMEEGQDHLRNSAGYGLNSSIRYNLCPVVNVIKTDQNWIYINFYIYFLDTESKNQLS